MSFIPAQRIDAQINAQMPTLKYDIILTMSKLDPSSMVVVSTITLNVLLLLLTLLTPATGNECNENLPSP